MTGNVLAGNVGSLDVFFAILDFLSPFIKVVERRKIRERLFFTLAGGVVFLPPGRCIIGQQLTTRPQGVWSSVGIPLAGTRL